MKVNYPLYGTAQDSDVELIVVHTFYFNVWIMVYNTKNTNISIRNNLHCKYSARWCCNCLTYHTPGVALELDDKGERFADSAPPWSRGCPEGSSGGTKEEHGGAVREDEGPQ